MNSKCSLFTDLDQHEGNADDRECPVGSPGPNVSLTDPLEVGSCSDLNGAVTVLGTLPIKQ